MMNFSVIEELVIARLNGHEYPSEAKENELFHKYLQFPRRFAKSDTLVLVDDEVGTVPNALEHIVMLHKHYPYTILSIKTKNGGDRANSSAPSDPFCSELNISSKYHTNVVMKTNVSKRVIPIRTSFEYIQAYIREHAYIQNRCTSICYARSVLLPLGIGNTSSSRFAQLQLSDNPSLERTNADMEDKPSNHVSSRYNNYLIDSKQEITRMNVSYLDYLTDTLLSVLAPVFGNNKSNRWIQFSLMKDPVLLACDSSVCFEDLRNSLHVCAEHMGVTYLEIDARMIVRYPNKTFYADLITYCRPQLQTAGGNSLDLTPSCICSMAPCVIHIIGLDRIFDDPSQQHSAVPEDSVDSSFTKAFRLFLGDLYSHIESTVMQEDDDDDADDDDDDDDDDVEEDEDSYMNTGIDSDGKDLVRTVGGAGEGEYSYGDDDENISTAGSTNDEDDEDEDTGVRNDDLSDNAISVVVSTQCASNMSASLKALFATVLPFTKALNDAQRARLTQPQIPSYRVLNRQESNGSLLSERKYDTRDEEEEDESYTRNMSGMSDPMEKANTLSSFRSIHMDESAREHFKQHCEAMNTGYTYTKTLLRELSLQALLHEQGKRWLYDAGFIDSHRTFDDRNSRTENSQQQIREPLSLTPASSLNPKTSYGCNDYKANNALRIRKEDLDRTINSVPHLQGFDTTVGEHTNQSAGKPKQQQQSSISPVYWADIGGLDRVRREILDVLELPYLYPHLFFPGCPRRQGVLLYGPPGTGKTLVARAVATECKMSFLSVKGPELLDAYVGESEKNVREVFERARSQAPCVLFFDEIDSLAPARARGNDSGGGVMDRIVSQLLTEIDQIASSNSAQANEPNFTTTSAGTAVKGTSIVDAKETSRDSIDKDSYLYDDDDDDDDEGDIDDEMSTSTPIYTSASQEEDAMYPDQQQYQHHHHRPYNIHHIKAAALGGRIYDPEAFAVPVNRDKSNDSSPFCAPLLMQQRRTHDQQLSNDISDFYADLPELRAGNDDNAGADSINTNHKNSDSNKKFVFIIAATNRPDLLDPALLRPGRFDRKIYLGVCKDNYARAQILQAQTRKFQLAVDVDLVRVAAALPENVTGADIGAVTSAAFSNALQRKLADLRQQAANSTTTATATSTTVAEQATVAATASTSSTTTVAGVSSEATEISADVDTSKQKESQHHFQQQQQQQQQQESQEDDTDDWAVRSFINRLPETALNIRVTQQDLLCAATSLKPSVVDLAYYEHLGALYDDSQAITQPQPQPTKQLNRS